MLPSAPLEGWVQADPWNTHKNSNISPPLGNTLLFEAIQGPSKPCPWGSYCTVRTKGQDAERENETENGLIHARVQHFFFYISSHNFFLISLGQANIFLHGILGQYCRSSRNPFQNNSLEFQGITHSYQRVFFPEIMLNMILRQWNLKYNTNLIEPGKNTDKWMDVWKKHEILIQMKHALGKFFFFFSICRSACIGNAHAQCSPCISSDDSTYPLATL